MSTEVEALVLFLASSFQMFLRTRNILYISQGERIKATLNSVVISSTYLIAVSLGVKGALEGNWLLIATFLFSNSIGTYLGSSCFQKDTPRTKRS